jgi:hypothetical protein
VDHVHYFPSVDIDQHYIVVIADPLIWAIYGRQTIVDRIVDEEPRLEEQAV